ncbi:membrane protein [Escherichia phage vB_EcoP_WFI101126]|uniref:Uncharacterized protein n=1 Tax=Escherichia phage vB_EcoP_WFI101126 TaxID=2508203 RepID=A0A482MS03_9CAUD|nr:membrane protein [Escherichia phage vB_EcoP_WFI101126]QBQ76525.1 hypothetical protein WFI101126_00097 [Escherichia phage vB_EcoP_WFI101126]
MIKINKNGWLHKLNKTMSGLPNPHWDNMTNFCEYFWRTVMHFIALTLLLGIVYAALSMIGGSLLGHENFCHSIGGHGSLPLLLVPYLWLLWLV